MAVITEVFQSSEAIGATEWSVASDTSYDTGDAQTTDGCYQLFLDLSDMVAGDILQIKTYEKILSGGTQRAVRTAILGDLQKDPHWASDALLLIHGWDYTLKALAGTITVVWSVRSVS